MSRTPRIHFSGAVYHAMARGVDGRDIFVDDRDRLFFLDSMRRIEKETSANIIAFCLMGNHFHFAIKVGQIALSSIMQRISTSHVMKFNLRHGRTGHLFQARYKAVVCLNEKYLATLIRYIHMNPVRAGLVAAPQDWPWSSYRCGEDDSADFLGFDPWPTDAVQEFDLIQDEAKDKTDLAIIGSGIVARTGVCIEEIRSSSRRRPAVMAKRLVAVEAIASGYPLNVVARWLNVSPSAVTRYACWNNANTARPDPIL